MSDFWNDLRDAIPGDVVGAIILLIVGWFVAKILGSVATKAIRKSGLEPRIARLMGRSGESGSGDAAAAGGKIVYFGVLAFILIAVFDLLNMPLITQPLNDLLSGIFGYIPRLLGAAILALLAWILATIVKTLVFEVLQGVNVDGRLKRLQKQEDTGGEPAIARGLAELAFALILLFFLPAILSALQLNGILEPVQKLFDEFFAFIPNLIAAAVIIVVGWFVAKFVAQLVSNLLAAVGTDRFGERVGISSSLGARKLSGTIGLLVYILILIPVIIAGLNALQLESITAPASNMLDSILQYIPRAFGAAAILAIAYVVGKIVSELIASLLAGTWYDSLFSQLGVSELADETGADTSAASGFSLAKITGQAILAAILWFAAIAALEALQLYTISELFTDLLGLAGHILLGMIIFVVGLLLARLAGQLVRRSSSGQQAGFASAAAQAAVLVLFGAMALRQMGVANDIINLAFGILLGAIGIAIAIAFGVGGRDAASRQLDQWIGSAKDDSSTP